MDYDNLKICNTTMYDIEMDSFDAKKLKNNELSLNDFYLILNLAEKICFSIHFGFITNK